MSLVPWCGSGRLRRGAAAFAIASGAALLAVPSATGAEASTPGTSSTSSATASSAPLTDTSGTGPAQPNIVAAGGYAVLFPNAAPPGANNWSCRPSAAHPNPVLLSNGTFANAYEDWAGLSGVLAAAGYCVFVPNLGGAPGSPVQTVGPIEDTAQGLAEFTDRILAATGARKVDVVGHSQGGMNPRYWIKNLGGAAKISKLIGLAPSNHGTDFNQLLTSVATLPGGPQAVATACPACAEQTQGSAFITALNAGGETVSNIDYTVLESKYDEVVTPYTSAFLAPGPNVRNVLLQDLCGLDYVDHLGITYDPIVRQLVLNALDPAHATPPPCVFVPPAVD